MSPGQKRVAKKRTHTTRVEEPETQPTTTSTEELKNDLDSILDEIDELLESNAEEFVKSYVQKGGQ